MVKEKGMGKMVLGITGGVGSGKSTVLTFLQKEYPVEICMADELGHEVMRRGMPAYDSILEAFGKSVVGADREVDRNALAKIVYADSSKLQTLNEIIHPSVLDEIRRRAEETKPDEIFILESALLFETNCQEFCHEVWGIITDDEIRIKRLMSSRGYTREKAMSIMEKQLSNQELVNRCDRIIVNDGDVLELRKQLRGHMEKILEK